MATWREQRGIDKVLRRRVWARNDRVLDIPCGTGILATVLAKFPFRVVAGDISMAMISLARGAYAEDRFSGFVQADITETPLRVRAFTCVITLGLMHRVPDKIKRVILREIASLSKDVMIISYSVDGRLQHVKRWLLQRLFRGYEPAPCASRLQDIVDDCRTQGLLVKEWFRTIPFFSAEVVLVLEKKS